MVKPIRCEATWRFSGGKLILLSFETITQLRSRLHCYCSRMTGSGDGNGGGRCPRRSIRGLSEAGPLNGVSIQLKIPGPRQSGAQLPARWFRLPCRLPREELYGDHRKPFKSDASMSRASLFTK